MTAINLTPLRIPGAIESPGMQPKLNPMETPEKSFADMLGDFVQSVDSLGAEAESAKQAFLNGEPVDLHEVMILSEESGIAFDLLLELRNKLVEAYQELSRMPL